MNSFRIFTESKADVKFLKDYIAAIFNIALENTDFDTLGSWSGYKAGGKLLNAIKENSVDNGNLSILVLDADADFSARFAEVVNDFDKYGVPVRIFLFPNHAHNGNMETMLAEIAVNRKLMDCFLEYEKCVSGHPRPLNDSRIYSYLDMLLYPDPRNEYGKDLRREEYRNYRNNEHWNLAHPYLNPLRNFLATLF